MSFYFLASLMGIVGDCIGSGKYVVDVLKNRTRPHIFSWLVWAILMSIGAAIQLAEGSWATALSLGFGAIINYSVFGLGYRQGDHNITRSDWAFLSAALLTIPVWLLTSNPLWAAILVSTINLAGSAPTFRKAWIKPNEENLFSFSVYTGVSVLRILSITPFTFVTALYPMMIFGTCITITAIILWRRRAKPLIVSAG